MQVREVPKIQQQPRTASETAIHYGYVAFKDIGLLGPLGLEIRCQPDNSLYRHNLPCRELIPFTNISHGTVNEEGAGIASVNTNPNSATKIVQKTAKQCIDDVIALYQDWAFVELDAITGFSEEDAFRIFQFLQPFHYRIADLVPALDEAQYRIDADEPVEVFYGDISVELEPLPKDFRDTARKVLGKLQASAKRAEEKASEILNHTTISMTSAFSGGEGKRVADPLDRYISKEMDWEIPKLLTTSKEKEGKPVTYGESPESLELKRREIELREKELELRAKEIELLEKQANRDKMAQVRAAKKEQ